MRDTRLAVAPARPALRTRLLSTSQVHATRPTRRASSSSSLTSLLNWQLSRDRGEQLLDVLARLRTGLEEEEVGFLRVRFGVGGGHSALVGLFGDEIEFVTCEADDNVLIGLALQFFDP